MDRELLIEIGCEEIPASWLPGLTSQLASHLDARLKAARLTSDRPSESYSTPRRLTARVAKLAERQSDHEELITGPPVSAAFKPDGEPTPAAAGFAKKYGVEVGALERSQTPKGAYLAYRVHQRGKATVDVLADVLGGLLRDLTFPKQMRWDAYLEDGKGDLVFARPIRWLILLYGGRVVPFVIRRTEMAQGPLVQDVRSGPNTYGHRFLTTSGRAGRAIKVKTFEDYEARLLENFVILNRSERESKIRRELEMHARKLGGRVSGLVAAQSSLLQEVPDLVEYPSVVAGHFPVEFLQLPEEVLTTTMIHHQHYFPVVDDEGKLKPAFLAVTNTQAEKPEIIARNSERVLTARLRDARFFWDEDRKATLESRVERLSTLLFHKKLGTYKDKVSRIETLARWIAKDGLGASDDTANRAASAARLCKADLATDMVREFPELQGVMGGVYARAEGQPEDVWKAIYHHYLPHGVEADAPPTKAMLGKAAVSWAAVSLADKLDTLVGMFIAGEKPTGSRDPFGLRRAAQGVVKILADYPHLELDRLLQETAAPHRGSSDDISRVSDFLWERNEHLLEQRGAHDDEIRVIRSDKWKLNNTVAARVTEFKNKRNSEQFRALAALFKRVKNITSGVGDDGRDLSALRTALKEPAELALADAMIEKEPVFHRAVASKHFGEAVDLIAELYPYVDRFFNEVLVMTDDVSLRDARLMLLARLYRNIRQNIGDISEMAPEAKQA
jgi:glycyl-tRNA synthetase beta chain